MRLLESERVDIINTFKTIFHRGSIYLFGSRVNDRQKGGDLDLYLVSDSPLDVGVRMKKKRDFVLRLEELLGEQKIDVVVSKDKSRMIEREALEKGELLWS